MYANVHPRRCNYFEEVSSHVARCCRLWRWTSECWISSAKCSSARHLTLLRGVARWKFHYGSGCISWIGRYVMHSIVATGIKASTFSGLTASKIREGPSMVYRAGSCSRSESTEDRRRCKDRCLGERRSVLLGLHSATTRPEVSTVKERLKKSSVPASVLQSSSTSTPSLPDVGPSESLNVPSEQPRVTSTPAQASSASGPSLPAVEPSEAPNVSSDQPSGTSHAAQGDSDDDLQNPSLYLQRACPVCFAPHIYRKMTDAGYTA